MPSTSILLSTYNGQKYVRQQIESILGQSYRNFKLYIRDDGSNDDTLQIVKSFRDSRIVLIEDDLGNLGPTKSFIELLRRVKSDIYMFCDQDDIWLENKVRLTLESFIASKKDFKIRPLLVHTDLVIVDENLCSSGLTFNQHENISIPGDYSLFRLLVQNCIVGCTVAVNEALVDKAKVRFINSDNIAMHDWWLALVASRFGEIIYLEKPLILYRQHGGNVSGLSQKGKIIERIRSIFNGNGLHRIAKYCLRISRQGSEFLEIFHSQLHCSEIRKLSLFISAYSMGSFLNLIKCFLFGVRFKKLYMNCAVVLCNFHKKKAL